MPESPRMTPLYLARIADLRHDSFVAVTCRGCGHVAELPVSQLRRRLAPNLFVKRLGPQFRCRQCGRKGAELDARKALGH
jgi:predicted nucleic-acid-binding Zn-ribbon protein